ncbi:ABC transporter ATP-binding protein [Nonomuraea sp. NPDC049152]|uniref:ABC transporter ATP-binding protein n=1 Tax=Nonomuraea sp. NPDC049152 TaxID=3154350 RepID=UPI0033DF4445
MIPRPLARTGCHRPGGGRRRAGAGRTHRVRQPLLEGAVGGERQRAHIARALAQQPYGLLLDEPTNHLDVKHRLELMELLTSTDQTVLVALHDLTLAARYCDRLLLLYRGRLIASGTPAAVLTSERLADVFELDAELITDSLGHPQITYRRPLSSQPTTTSSPTAPSRGSAASSPAAITGVDLAARPFTRATAAR